MITSMAWNYNVFQKLIPFLQYMARQETKKHASMLFQLHMFPLYTYISHYVTSGIEITPCNKIDKPLVVYRFTGMVMMSIST